MRKREKEITKLEKSEMDQREGSQVEEVVEYEVSRKLTKIVVFWAANVKYDLSSYF